MKAGEFTGSRTPRGELDVEGARHAVAIAAENPDAFPGLPEQLRALAKDKKNGECNRLAADVIGKRYIT